MTNSFTIPYRQGLTIGRALASTGSVGFSADDQIVSIGGVPISGNVGYQIKLNGRTVPATLLNYTIQPSDTVTLELYAL
ncbi:hypothetical protein B1748_20580 [Paenibacillus sp. MY03]|nr:hypothetical protein B1748_20580 [Paenibacillus sp. MY03]